MFLFLNDYNHIACFSIRYFVSFSMLYVLLPIGCTLINLHRNLLSFLLQLLAIANLAHFCRVDTLTLAATLIAGTCSLRVHARA